MWTRLVIVDVDVGVDVDVDMDMTVDTYWWSCDRLCCCEYG